MSFSGIISCISSDTKWQHKSETKPSNSSMCLMLLDPSMTRRVTWFVGRPWADQQLQDGGKEIMANAIFSKLSCSWRRERDAPNKMTLVLKRTKVSRATTFRQKSTTFERWKPSIALKIHRMLFVRTCLPLATRDWDCSVALIFWIYLPWPLSTSAELPPNVFRASPPSWAPCYNAGNGLTWTIYHLGMGTVLAWMTRLVASQSECSNFCSILEARRRENPFCFIRKPCVVSKSPSTIARRTGNLKCFAQLNCWRSMK